MKLIDRGPLMFDYLQRLGTKDTYKAKYEALAAAVDNSPAIDAVSVIRCKECDHADLDIPMNKNFVYCNMWGTFSYGNGYCHHSARLTGEEDD